MKRGFFAIIIGHILGLFYLVFNNKIKIELANFVITFFAFGAAIYAIYYQHQESKQAEKHFQEQFALQKEAALKQETIGAWQVLANKASGNSGKKEAIEFLASQDIPLWGIDMSEKTHGGRVYLDGLFFKDFQGDRSEIDLIGANFSGADLRKADFSEAIFYSGATPYGGVGGVDFSEANLYEADFSGSYLEGANFFGADLLGANFFGADLRRANFSGSYLEGTNFSGSYLGGTNFSGADLFGTNFSGSYLGGTNFSGTTKLYNKKGFDKAFIDCYCYFDNYSLPKPPPGYKFEFDERTDENNQPIYPKNNPDYRYIKLIK